MAEPRTYRNRVPKDRFASFTIRYKETDLWIGVDPASYRPRMPGDVLERIVGLRSRLELYIGRHPEFLTSFEPLPPDTVAPHIAATMLAASARAGVGPMAAVAGAFSDAAARFLVKEYRCREVVVENGGDIALSGTDGFTAALLAGGSVLSGRIGLRIRGNAYRGLATSAGRVGPSYSAGKADACAVLASDAATADAFATAFGNRVGCSGDIASVLERARKTVDVLGCAVISGSAFGCVGDLEIVPLRPETGKASGTLSVGKPGARLAVAAEEEV